MQFYDEGPVVLAPQSLKEAFCPTPTLVSSSAILGILADLAAWQESLTKTNLPIAKHLSPVFTGSELFVFSLLGLAPQAFMLTPASQALDDCAD